MIKNQRFIEAKSDNTKQKTIETNWLQVPFIVQKDLTVTLIIVMTITANGEGWKVDWTSEVHCKFHINTVFCYT